VRGSSVPYARIYDCYFNGSVSGASSVGGLAGWNQGSRADNCYSSGSISCPDTSTRGGLFGSAYENAFGKYPAENCFATAGVVLIGFGSYTSGSFGPVNCYYSETESIFYGKSHAAYNQGGTSPYANGATAWDFDTPIWRSYRLRLPTLSLLNIKKISGVLLSQCKDFLNLNEARASAWNRVSSVYVYR
jgi:hypothetical protein